MSEVTSILSITWRPWRTNILRTSWVPSSIISAPGKTRITSKSHSISKRVSLKNANLSDHQPYRLSQSHWLLSRSKACTSTWSLRARMALEKREHFRSDQFSVSIETSQKHRFCASAMWENYVCKLQTSMRNSANTRALQSPTTQCPVSRKANKL